MRSAIHLAWTLVTEIFSGDWHYPTLDISRKGGDGAWDRIQSVVIQLSVLAQEEGRWNLALALFAVMSKSRIQRDTFTYSSVLSGCNLEWELALCAFKDADADEIVFNAAIDTCGHGGWTMGVKLFNDMGTKVIQRAQRRRLRSTDCKSLVTYTAVGFTCGAARWELVESLLVEMKNDKARCDLPNWFYLRIYIMYKICMMTMSET